MKGIYRTVYRRNNGEAPPFSDSFMLHTISTPSLLQSIGTESWFNMRVQSSAVASGTHAPRERVKTKRSHNFFVVVCCYERRETSIGNRFERHCGRQEPDALSRSLAVKKSMQPSLVSL